MSSSGEPGAITQAELATQPDMWRRAAATPADEVERLPAAGQRVLVLGCGTSYYIGEAYARRRRAAGLGATRAEIPSQLDFVEDGAEVLLLSRSGTTGDLITVGRELAAAGHRVTAILGTPGSPLHDLVPHAVILDYADEHSIMQTRFATTALSLLRRTLGEDLSAAIEDAETALTASLPVVGPAFEALEHIVFLGDRWSAAVAQEAALKVREAAGFWTEAYPLLEYQHGPISCAGSRSLIWAFCDVPEQIVREIEATGARVERGTADAQAELVRAHRLAVGLALREGRNPDAPPHLSRSVIDPVG